MEVEIETAKVFGKELLLRSTDNVPKKSLVEVYECENPYILIFTVDVDDGRSRTISCRMDVTRDDLALELRLWLGGKIIEYPCLPVTVRIEEGVSRFVKFGKAPLQSDLILWLLSRSQLTISEVDNLFNAELIFGGSEKGVYLKSAQYPSTVQNTYAKTVRAASLHETFNRSEKERVLDSMLEHSNSLTDDLLFLNDKHSTARSSGYVDDLGMYKATHQILGRSAALSLATQDRIKGRPDAKPVVNTLHMSATNAQLVADLKTARKKIEQSMDIRRQTIEAGKTRQVQAADRYRTIQEDMKRDKFEVIAQRELLALQKVQRDVEADIVRQKFKAQREVQRVAWTLAPSAFANRRGRHQRGAVIGTGPLPPHATTSLKDPRLEKVYSRYYWDSAGRRHLRRSDNDESAGNECLVEAAMNALRTAANNILAYKLNLRALFDHFDRRGDGLLTEKEIAEAFLRMGVKLDAVSLDAIFRHFDPNESGAVHWGEFVWAFYNRRVFVRRWKKASAGLTMAQIRDRFHRADRNGNGQLTAKELQLVLQSFEMNVSDDDMQILADRFDLDGDGDLDLEEFIAFVHSEQHSLIEQRKATAKKEKEKPKWRGVIGSMGRQEQKQSGDDSSPPPRIRMRSRSLDATRSARSPSAKIKQPKETKDFFIDQIVRQSLQQLEEADTRTDIDHKNSVDTSSKGLSDPLWMTRMLKAQAEIESRIGRKYYSVN